LGESTPSAAAEGDPPLLLFTLRVRPDVRAALASVPLLLLPKLMSSVVKDCPTSVAVLRGLSRAACASRLGALWSLKLPLMRLKEKSSSEALKLLRSWACLSRLLKLACGWSV
jgi:hypothetical protein